MLGDRLATCDDEILKKQAQICYICSGNLNKMIEVSESGIQETVEMVMIMQQAMEIQGIKDLPIDGKIAGVLSNYAEILSAEGNLKAALGYLGNSQEPRIVMLRERLCRALGYIQPTVQQTVPRVATQQNYYEKSAARKPYQNTYVQPTTPVQNWNTAPTKNAYGSGMTNQSNTQQPIHLGGPIQQQSSLQDQYSAMNSYGQMNQPQAPPPPMPVPGANVVSSRPSSVGPQSRSKYILDPSVKSTPAYGNAYQQTPVYNPSAPVPGYPTQNSYPGQQMPLGGYPSQPQSSMYNPLEQESFKSQSSNIMTPMALPAQTQPQTQLYDPMRAQTVNQTPSYNTENTYQPTPQPYGWNDPPAGKLSRTQVTFCIYLLGQFFSKDSNFTRVLEKKCIRQLWVLFM